MPAADVARLRWRCRRGLKEMDLLLERFLAEHYPALGTLEQGQFARFLDENDADILAWLTGICAPSRPEYGAIVLQLRRLGAAAGGRPPGATPDG